MGEKEKIIKSLLNNLTLLMKNQEFYDKFTGLLNTFSDIFNVRFEKQKDGNYAYILFDDNNELHILFAQNLNDINITYKNGNVNKDIKIKICQNEINIYEKEKIENIDEVITKETNKMYLNDYLIRSTYNELLENKYDKKTKFEELLVMKDGGAFFKIINNSQVMYLETNSFKNTTFNNRNKDIEEQQSFELSNIERYNYFMIKYEISLLPIRFVDVIYISGGNENNLSGILLSSNSKGIELLIDDDQLELPYKQILNISCNGKEIYSNYIKNKKMTL